MVEDFHEKDKPKVTHLNAFVNCCHLSAAGSEVQRFHTTKGPVSEPLRRVVETVDVSSRPYFLGQLNPFV